MLIQTKLTKYLESLNKEMGSSYTITFYANQSGFILDEGGKVFDFDNFDELEKHVNEELLK